jgi:hypothetical protein
VGGTMSWNDTGLPTHHPHNTGDDCTVWVGRTEPRYDSQAVSEDQHAGGSSLTQARTMCQSI